MSAKHQFSECVSPVGLADNLRHPVEDYVNIDLGTSMPVCATTGHARSMVVNEEEPSDCTYIDKPPEIEGSCDGCPNQVLVNSYCTEGFICNPDDYPGGEEGCLLTCPSRYRIVPNFSGNQLNWTCIEEHDQFCPGEFKMYCESDPVEAIDPSSCRCDGEVLVSGDCQTGEICVARGDTFEVRTSINCGGDEHISLNFAQGPSSMECVENNDNCPGGGGFRLGCGPGAPIPTYQDECEIVTNPLGICSCNYQAFVNRDCTAGFQCLDEVQAENSGCLFVCDSGTKIVPRFSDSGRRVEWNCIDANLHSCPGEFNITCPADQIILDEVTCECEGQLFVTDDCHQSAFCLSRGDQYESRTISCSDDEIVTLDYSSFTWDCATDFGTCPGQGGFHFGCGAGRYEVPYLCQDVSAESAGNDFGFGDCFCNDQVFIDYDCTRGFQCRLDVAESLYNDGCLHTCAEGELLRPILDASNDTSVGFECVDESTYTCPGAYVERCPGQSPIESSLDSSSCDCEGQLLVVGGCQKSLLCTGGLVNTCAPGQIVDVDITNLNNVGCKTDDGSCPSLGGYKLGCNDGVDPDPTNPTTTSPPPSTTTPSTITTTAGESTTSTSGGSRDSAVCHSTSLVVVAFSVVAATFLM